MWRIGLATLLVAPLLALGTTGSATAAYPVQYCASVPIVQGIPPWGFHTGSPISGATGSYARGHGDISLSANTVSGILCQVDRVRHQPDRLIIMTVKRHPRCQVGTIGHVTLFASYNNVRSDSVQFFFPAACKGHDHLYHGPQVNNQVPPL